MSVKTYLILLVGLLYASYSIALPPPNIISSCKDQAPFDINITMTQIKVAGYIKSNDKKCEDQFEIGNTDKTFGFVRCEDTGYIIAGNKKIVAKSALNMSVHPGITPGDLIPDASNWWRINDKHNDYLCIAGPISETGFGSNHMQYYIIDNAFNDNEKNAYYLYFDRPGASNLNTYQNGLIK
jgi:hypothetical protein